MKITVNVECTPEEARTFLGLPDLKPMQDALVSQLQERLGASITSMDGDALLRSWLPSGFQGMEQFTRAMLHNFDLALGREPRT